MEGAVKSVRYGGSNPSRKEPSRRAALIEGSSRGFIGPIEAPAILAGKDDRSSERQGVSGVS